MYITCFRPIVVFTFIHAVCFECFMLDMLWPHTSPARHSTFSHPIFASSEMEYINNSTDRVLRKMPIRFVSFRCTEFVNGCN